MPTELKRSAMRLTTGVSPTMTARRYMRLDMGTLTLSNTPARRRVHSSTRVTA